LTTTEKCLGESSCGTLDGQSSLLVTLPSVRFSLRVVVVRWVLLFIVSGFDSGKNTNSRY